MVDHVEQPSVRDLISDTVQEAGDAASADVGAADAAAPEVELTAENIRDFVLKEGVDPEEIKGLDNAALLKAYQDADKDDAASKAPTAWDRHWKFTDKDGKALTDPADLRKVLEHKIEYKAGGKMQQHSVDELIRLAQRTGPAEQRTQYLVQQRNEAFEKATKAEATIAAQNKDRDTWFEALMDPTGKKFLDLQVAFLRSGGKSAAPAEAAQPASPYTPEQEAQGELRYQREILPHLSNIAQTYSYQGQPVTVESARYLQSELDRVFRAIVNQEGAYFANNPAYREQRLAEIINHDLPHLAMAAGFAPPGVTSPAVAAASTSGAAIPTAPTGKLDDSAAELARLKAENQNLRLKATKSKLKSAPDGGNAGGTGGNTGVPTLDKAKSWKDMRNRLRDPEENFGL